jgi:hypothetical protein
MIVHRLAAATALAFVLVGPCLADAPVATSNGDEAPMAGAKGPATPEQVETAAPYADDPIDAKPRLHGEVGVSVGSGGYRSAYGAVSGPIGDNGYFGLAFSQSKGDRRGGWYPSADGPIGLAGGLGVADCVAIERQDGASDPALTAGDGRTYPRRSCHRGAFGY